jgi:hypothetical protein
MRLGMSLFAIALLLACSSSSNHASSDAGSDSANEGGPDTGSGSGSGSESDGASGSGGSGSGSSSGPPTDASGQPPCTLTLQGAVSFAGACTTTTEYFTAANRTTFSIAVADQRPLQQISITVQRPGHPMSGTWSSTDPGATGGALVQAESADAGSPTWQCTAGPATSEDAGATDSGAQDGGSAGGSYTLNLMLGRGMPMPTGESFGSTGTFAATLPAVTQSGAMGTVTMHVDF